MGSETVLRFSYDDAHCGGSGCRPSRAGDGCSCTDDALIAFIGATETLVNDLDAALLVFYRDDEPRSTWIKGPSWYHHDELLAEFVPSGPGCPELRTLTFHLDPPGTAKLGSVDAPERSWLLRIEIEGLLVLHGYGLDESRARLCTHWSTSGSAGERDHGGPLDYPARLVDSLPDVDVDLMRSLVESGAMARDLGEPGWYRIGSLAPHDALHAARAAGLLALDPVAKQAVACAARSQAGSPLPDLLRLAHAVSL